jgi:hypothetical protein
MTFQHCSHRPNETLGKRLWLDKPEFYSIRALIEEVKAKTVLFVFPQQCALKSFYENLSVKWIPTRLVVSKKDELGFALAIEERTYNNCKQSVMITAEGKVSEVSNSLLLKTYRSFQTCLPLETIRIKPDFIDMVFLFTSSELPRRWIQWLDTRCGKHTTLCLVGKNGAFH